ncbi:MAG: transposase [Acidobacteriota bacterium]
MKDEEKIPATNSNEIEALIKRFEGDQLRAGDKNMIARLLRMWLVVLGLMDKPKTTLDKVKQMLFGKSRNNRSKSESDRDKDSTSQTSSQTDKSTSDPSQAKQSTVSNNEAQGEVKPKRRGHGRLATTDYPGAQRVYCEDPALKEGEPCLRQGCLGHLYDPAEAHRFIRFESRPFVDDTLYEQKVMRCNNCGTRFSAPLPPGVVPEKYDETADVAIAIYRYGAGLPHYRMAKMQQMKGVPLPATTQWERCDQVADLVYPVVSELERQAAQTELLQGDDTGVVILSLVKENEELPKGSRVGMQTTGIGAKIGAEQIALYYSGRRHTGENLAKLLKTRNEELDLPKVVGDAAAKNWSPQFKCMVIKCLQHARQNFVDVKEAFKDKCEKVLTDLAAVYKNDAQTRLMNEQDRLAYHQQHSAPIMAELKKWLENLLATNQVEDNDGMGQATKYFLKHYPELTQFLKIAGAPLDNSHAEQILKRAVLHRKNSLFFKTEHGSLVADTILSLIETCWLNKVNAFDYLVTLMRNARAVRARPDLWLPWNYHQHKVKQTA